MDVQQHPHGPHATDHATDHPAVRAERAWHAGDAVGAIEAADRALAAGDDPDGRAAGVAAAAAAADGALLDAARRWRGIAGSGPDATGVWASGRAALAAALAGDVDAAGRALTDAGMLLPDPAPRGLAVMLDGVACVLDALRGDAESAARRLTGLAAATVPPDPLAVERWDELAVTMTAAGGDAAAAAAMIDRQASAPTARRTLLAAWLDLRTGRFAEARDALTAASATPVLRRNAVLAAAVSVGLARRTGDADALASTWHRVAPVMAGADVEILLLGVWGELSAGAALVSPEDGEAIAAAMDAAVRRAGSPWWAVATAEWWRLERAVAADDTATATAAGRMLTALAVDHRRVRLTAEAAAAWSAVLAGTVDAPTVAVSAGHLAAAGLRWEATALCRAAAARASDPADARQLLGACRHMRVRETRGPRPSGGDLSAREREVGALVVDGLTHKEIGKRLYISPKTVEQHVARLRQKLLASNRASLVAAIRERL